MHIAASIIQKYRVLWLRIGCKKRSGKKKRVVRITRNIVPGKDPWFPGAICTSHQPGTTYFRCGLIEMVNERGLPIASGLVVFDTPLVVRSPQKSMGVSDTSFSKRLANK
jgi:hypothetical protein